MNPKTAMTPRLNILLVEDEQADRMLITKAAHDSGFDVQLKYAENVEDALTMVSLHNFDCILLDYYFTNNRSGFEFIRAYHGANGDTPIIMVTSYNEPSLIVESMKMGASDYIAKKDISPENLAKSFSYILRLREAEANRILAEKALLESELRLKTIIERSPVIVFTIDNNGYFKLFKGKGANTLSLKPGQIIGHNINDIWMHLPVKKQDYLNALNGDKLSCQSEVDNRHYEVSFFPVTNHLQKTTSMMGVAIDITDYKRNEVALLNAIEITEATSRIKEQFLANMSHEIRTPIHGIMSLIQFVENTTLNPDQKKYIDLISKSAGNLLAIVNDILDLSKIEAGKITLEEIPFDIRETVNACISTLSAKALEKNLEVELHIDESVPFSLSGDPVRLVQILNNLVGNSIKFTEKGRVSIDIKTTAINDSNCVLNLRVQDTGIGIPAKKLPHIFESFTQAGDDISRKYGGTGLGLTIAKKLIEQQNGTIEVESRVNKGTTFICNIPYSITALQQVTTEKVKETTMLDNIKILIAEDNDINRFIIEKMIRDTGAEMTFATSGEEAVRLASTTQFDIILMDVEMPGMNGYQATEMIRNELKIKNTPIIAMTGHAMSGEKNKCLECGMNDHIAKPFQADDLCSMISKWLKQASAKEQPAMEKTTYINLEFLREISDGNEAFFKEFIQLFLNSAPPAIADMQQHYNDKNWESLRQVAHKIKPSFNYIGLKELNQAAAKIEEYAKKQTCLEEIPALIEKIKTISEHAFRELTSEINAGLSTR